MSNFAITDHPQRVGLAGVFVGTAGVLMLLLTPSDQVVFLAGYLLGIASVFLAMQVASDTERQNESTPDYCDSRACEEGR